MHMGTLQRDGASANTLSALKRRAQMRKTYVESLSELREQRPLISATARHVDLLCRQKWGESNCLQLQI